MQVVCVHSDYSHKDDLIQLLSHLYAGESVSHPYTEADYVPVELSPGSAVFFNGYLLHRSLPNTTTSSFRRAFANHYMSAESMLPWTNDGRIAPTEDMRGVCILELHNSLC